MTDPASPRRRRRWPYVLLTLLVLTGAVAGLGWRYRIILADQAAKMALAIVGFGDGVSFRVTEVARDRLRLEDLALGENGPRASALEVAFAPGALTAGRIEAIRLIEPDLTVRQTSDGRIEVAGLPESLTGGDGTEDGAGTGFTELPDVGRIEIVNGRIALEAAEIAAIGLVDGAVVRREANSYVADISAALADADGRQSTTEATGVEIVYRPEAISISGPVKLVVADAAADAQAAAAIWLNGRAAADGAIEAEMIVMRGAGRLGADYAFDDLRGRIDVGQPAAGPSRARVDLNLLGLRAPSAAIELAAVAADIEGPAGGLLLDAVGPSGAVSAEFAAPTGDGPIAIEARGEVDAATVAGLIDPLDAQGRIRFVSTAALALDAFMADPDVRHIDAKAELILETPKLAIPVLAPEGSAFGQIDLAIAGGAATVTSPGVQVGGVNLPPAVLATLPLDVRRAFAEPSFVRLGGPGLPDTVVTVSRRPEGGFASVGKIGLGVSNPNLAVFLEGDAAVATDAVGAVEHIESDRLTVRMVEAAFGPATVSGRMDLSGLSGAGQTFAADARLEASAVLAMPNFEVKRAEIDLSGPLTIAPDRAVLAPRPGGSIVVAGYSGPQFSAPGPLRLTLTSGGARRIAYDRRRDEVDAALNFRGFETVAFLNSGDGDAGEVDLILGGFGVTVTPAGAALTVSDASARIAAYDIALERADGRIAFGGAATQTGRLVIPSIRHLAETPLFRPVSLTLDVKGRGDLLQFDGALIAAGERARLTVAGRHDLASGVGEATIDLPAVVFAPGVLQPQDFAPILYRTLLETIGEIGAAATLAWNADGLTRQTGQVDVSIDKLRTSEITVERLSSSFALDGLFPPSTDGPQRVRIGLLDIGVPLSSGAVDVDILSPNRVELQIQEFGLFGGLINSQVMTVDPTQESFEATLGVSGIDLSSILAFADFGELQASGQLEGRLPLAYAKGELRINDGLLKTADGGGALRYKPQAIDTALSEVDRSSELALKAIANFAYDEISIRINEVDAEELRLDIFIGGRSVDLFEGVPFEFNIVIEGPIRQIIKESLSPIELPNDVQDLLDAGQVVVDQPAAPVQ